MDTEAGPVLLEVPLVAADQDTDLYADLTPQGRPGPWPSVLTCAPISGDGHAVSALSLRQHSGACLGYVGLARAPRCIWATILGMNVEG